MSRLGNLRCVWPAKLFRYAVLVAILVIAGLRWRSIPVPELADFQFPALSIHKADAKVRKIYPYSVIVGGAYTGEELVRARKTDAVVARHYAGFGSTATVRQIAADTLMYVSYRKSDRVFWTKAKHRIPKGESVLCDGDNYARVRCGNRLALKPQSPVSSDEPTEEAFDIPDAPKASLLASNPSAPAPDAEFFVPAESTNLNLFASPTPPGFGGSNAPLTDSGRPYAFESSPRGGGPFLGNSLFYPATGTGRGNGTGAGPGTSPDTPGTLAAAPLDSVVSPEPGSIQLFILGLMVSAAFAGQIRRFGARGSDRTR